MAGSLCGVLTCRSNAAVFYCASRPRTSTILERTLPHRHRSRSPASSFYGPTASAVRCQSLLWMPVAELDRHIPEKVAGMGHGDGAGARTFMPATRESRDASSLSVAPRSCALKSSSAWSSRLSETPWRVSICRTAWSAGSIDRAAAAAASPIALRTARATGPLSLIHISEPTRPY